MLRIKLYDVIIKTSMLFSFYVMPIITCILTYFNIYYLKLLGVKNGIIIQFQEKGHDKREYYNSQATTIPATQLALNLSFQLHYIIESHSASYTNLIL